MSLRTLALAVALAGGAILLPAQRQAGFTLPANVEVVPDLVYAVYGEKQLRLDLYLPKPRPAKPMPGIVVIRGGGWRQGDKEGFAPIAAGLAATGLAAACIEYRVLPEVSFPEPVYDTKAAVRWMRAEGKRYGIATHAIGAIGGSAGGHLVALLGTSYKVRALEGAGGHANVSSRVQAVVAMAPVVNFISLAKAKQRGGEAARSMFGEGAEMPKLLSPVTHMDQDAAPILLLHSNADQTVPFSQSQEMLERSKQAGVRAELVSVEGAPHAFWNQRKWAVETLETSARFFHSVLDGATPPPPASR